MSRKTTLKDIAAATGVTIASVSMIINGKDLSRFSPALVERVHDTAKKMHYVPPATRNELRQIAIISPSVNNAFHTTILMGIERAANMSNYLTKTYNTYWNPHTELNILKQLERHRVAGIIYLMHPLQMEKAREINTHTPVVAVGDIVNDLGIDTVDINNFKAGTTVARHLIRLGHKHIAYLTTSLNDYHVARVRRLEGIRETYQQMCPEGSVTVYCKDNRYEEEILSPLIELTSGRELAAQCLKNPQITAMVAINDMVGYGVLDGIIEAGFRVPEDYSLCGFDNAFPSAFGRIGLTTVDHSTEYHGSRAFHLLKDKIESIEECAYPNPITRVEYESQLIVRSSTGVPRK